MLEALRTFVPTESEDHMMTEANKSPSKANETKRSGPTSAKQHPLRRRHRTSGKTLGFQKSDGCCSHTRNQDHSGSFIDWSIGAPVPCATAAASDAAPAARQALQATPGWEHWSLALASKGTMRAKILRIAAEHPHRDGGGMPRRACASSFLRTTSRMASAQPASSSTGTAM